VGGVLATGNASFVAFAVVPDVTANVEVFATSSPQAVATIAVDAERLGELWSVIPAGNEVWSEQADEGETWTPIAAGSETWSQQVVGSEVWSSVTPSVDFWSER